MRPRGIRRLLRDWTLGRRHRYPWCCVAHFCWDGLIGWPSGVVRWRELKTGSNEWVPCGLFHSGGSPFSPVQRLVRIVAFTLARLLPTNRARAERRLARFGGPSWRNTAIDSKRRLVEAYGTPVV